ncbi:MFS transporter [Vibrio ouci]|uniref:MFS transporter n=1 Tax=Vibrio ouci TaxID=2499078 RepID=A0A4Y8WBL1_9VIBR|nr:MFS transporter [Vibrio ouci]TFH89788.1 MFS transporter [Vibrio ouci]
MNIVNKIIVISCVFYFPMWSSKTIHPIYWEELGKLDYFSYSYAAMAFIGSLAFIYPKVLASIGGKASLIAGFVFYAAGLMLRAYPLSTFLSVGSGILAGVGACLIGLCIKALINNIEGDTQQKAILWSNNSYTICQGVGILFSGWIVYLFAFVTAEPYLYASLIFAVLALTGIFSYKLFGQGNSDELGKHSDVDYMKFFSNNRSITLVVVASFFGIGVIQGFLLPLIPIFMNERGVEIQTISTILAASTVCGLLVQNLYAKIFAKEYAKYGLITICAIITILLAVFLSTLKGEDVVLTITIFGFLFMTLRSLVSFLIGVIEYQMVSKTDTIVLIGIIQSAFLSGDIIGGLLLPYVKNSDYLLDNSMVIPSVYFVLILLLSACVKKEYSISLVQNKK